MQTIGQELIDRCAPVSAGGLDLWVAFSERGLTMIVPAAATSFEELVRE